MTMKQTADHAERDQIAQIIARAYGGSLYPSLGVLGDYPTDDVDYRAADAILARQHLVQSSQDRGEGEK